ncbi:TonB-dependent receptor [Dokdonia sp. Hel_I_53]|uniref:TonB-dependent receptor n=1 Tax=Dokdonia sp. Hel_I_53 TaxID=1566287 RepID=UPI00119A1169|nr:TonB-dependent receptor [Dokdonia sp. Hel_I_53]TVZ51820.1 outer membrane receptor protein involved in Fe transport [Dokdonia sp. Hel_I_53]
MKKNWLLLLFCGCFLISQAQQKYTLSGTITDAASNETLIGVSLLFPEISDGVVTNSYGFYSITLPQGTYTVEVRYLGYSTVSKTFTLNQDIRENFELLEVLESLDEVIIEEKVERVRIRKPQMSVNALTAETIKDIPVVLGEADVIKAILLLPGVTSAGEGASGFNVRGGAADQNLILLDEATIFNSSHLFGFFSVFNPDAIKDLKLYKGGIPARYGGRVSSVLDIYQKEGNSKKFKVNGGIGAVSSRLLVEGPIVKDKAAFLLGGRASYAHLFLPLFNIDNSAYFYDLNTKINYNINDNNSLYLSGYFGRDLFSVQESFKNVYGNAVGNLRWNHIFSDKLFSNASLIYSDYYYGLDLDFVGFEWNSGISNINVKYDLTHYLNDKLKIYSGINNLYYTFNPGRIKPNGPDSGIVEEQLTKKYANEFAAYVDIEQKLSKNFTIEYGLRYSNFIRLGQDEINEYRDNLAVTFDPTLLIYQSADPIDVNRNGKRSDNLATFNYFEPRVAGSYAFNDDSSIKGSYTRLVQYLHLLSNTSSPTPLDIWTPSGPFVKPQQLDQYALGYFKNFSFRESEYTIESEVFFKDIKGRIDYIDGAQLIANNAIEQVILQGEGRAYGLEFLLRKNEGKLKGFLAYTLSKSEQRTPGRNENELGINRGKWYNTPYDKTHDISINASYEISKKWKLGSNFLFQTGQPTNFPIGQFEFQGIITPIYGPRNKQRLPSYHRLDLSATLTPQKNKNRKWQSEWVFSMYNIYNRRNAASINFRQNENTGANEAVRTSIFGIIPSVTYNFKF